MKETKHNSQKYQNIAVILLVGGYSSRMQTLKALLPFNKKESLLTHSLSLLQEGGIKHIYVVLGFEHERIEAHIKEWEGQKRDKGRSYQIVFNSRFDEGMYTSVCAGFNAILQDNENGKSNIDATFLLPVDAALLQTKSLNAILDYAMHTNNFHDSFTERQVIETPVIKSCETHATSHIKANRIIIPSFLGKCGHPPFITKEHFIPILQYENAFKTRGSTDKFRGLQGYFNQFLQEHMQKLFSQGLVPDASDDIKDDRVDSIIDFLPLADEGVLCDLDTPEEYEKAMQFLKLTASRKHMSLLESWHILTHNNLTERIIKHSYKVGLGAFRLYAHLQKKYAITDKDLLICFCGGLLHDICRLEKHHADVGGEFIASLGYNKVASIIKAHTNLPKEIVQELDCFIGSFSKQNMENLSEKENPNTKKNIFKMQKAFLPILCVHLSDKFYAGDTFIGMQKRFEYIKERFAGDEKALKAIKGREEIAKKVAYWFFYETNIIAEECVEISINHEFEGVITEEYNRVCF